MTVKNATSDKLDKNMPVPSQGGYWTARKLFASLSVFLIIWIGVYLFAHTEAVHSGYMNLKFNPAQIQEINRILYAKDETHEENIITTYDTLNTKKDSAGKNVTTSAQPVSVTRYITYSNRCDDSCRVNKAMLYIRSEFDNSIKPDQIAIIKEYIGSFSAQEVGAYLVNLKLKVKSYFWLTGSFIYVEMVFWSIIGVICSILFTIGASARTSSKADSYLSINEILYQVAKLFYAPFCTIVIVLCYNYIKHRNVIEVNTNEGMMVFSFVTGLFSGRMMNMLERFKDLLLPENIIVDHESTQKPAMKLQPVRDIHAETEERRSMPVPQPEYMTETAGYGNDKSDTVIDNVMIELKLDISGLFEEERMEIIKAGFDKAVVTMHSVNGKALVTARKTGESDIPSFLANNVEAGIYIIRCTLTQKLSDEYVMNLFGEKTAYITRDNKDIELYIKKYEAID